MGKRVLIISDNVDLCVRTSVIFEKYREFVFEYSTSPFSDHNLFVQRLDENVVVFDLRDEADIDIIISKYDLVISIHCKQLFPAKLFSKVRCINVHPGYNPINRGWYPQVFSIVNGSKIGATIHEIDEEIDHGRIIARAFVNKEIVDTSKSLYDKILNKEMELLDTHLGPILNHSYTYIEPESEGNLFLKKDFNKLCNLNLDERLTMLEFINKLRALSHGDFKNGFFTDPETGKKVFVSLSLEYAE